MALKEKKSGNYLSIIDGSLRKSVPEGTEGAIKREYETSDKKKGVKWELVYASLSGKITSIKFFDSEFGKQLSIAIKDDETYFVQLPYKGRYAMDLMKKLPNVDLEKEVEIAPFDFFGDNGKPIKGVSVMQGNEKVKNFFYDEATKKEKEIPQIEKEVDQMDSDDWQIHFTTVAKFLQSYIEKNVASKLENKVIGEEIMEDDIKYPEEEINPEDIPF